MAGALPAAGGPAEYDEGIPPGRKWPRVSRGDARTRLDRGGQLSNCAPGNRPGVPSTRNPALCRPYGHRIWAGALPEQGRANVAAAERGSVLRLARQTHSPAAQLQSLPAFRCGREATHRRAETSELKMGASDRRPGKS